MSAPTMERDAGFSDSGTHRYWLSRTWDASLPRAFFCMLNPATASHLIDDQTVRKDIGFCQQWGYGSFTVGNLYGYCATEPEDLVAAASAGIDIVGPENLAHVKRMASEADLTVAAWGASTPKFAALHVHRVTKLLAAIGDVYCIGRTKTGAPRHPVMTGYAQPLELFAAHNRAPSTDKEQQ